MTSAARRRAPLKFHPTLRWEPLKTSIKYQSPSRSVLSCTSNQFKCRNGECIDGSKHCDGVLDCRDRSDEYGCPCREYQFECSAGYCVDLSRRCDGYIDCFGGKDEENCIGTSMRYYLLYYLASRASKLRKS
uniref:Uncharacterized protein n=1 Tax=Vespula pensylvanica TaxID=30213 RepID=A0A834P9I1_VESPE|nr:hypothetical protein H0235_005418 [Vespula pensylvanica]